MPHSASAAFAAAHSGRRLLDHGPHRHCPSCTCGAEEIATVTTSCHHHHLFIASLKKEELWPRMREGNAQGKGVRLPGQTNHVSCHLSQFVSKLWLLLILASFLNICQLMLSNTTLTSTPSYPELKENLLSHSTEDEEGQTVFRRTPTLRERKVYFEMADVASDSPLQEH